MLSDEVIEKVIDRVVIRIEETNTYVLKKMGESVAKLRTLTPTQAQQLVQIMRYGGDYDKIAKALAKMSQLNIKDIYKIFEEVAKSDYRFAKQFYKYRNVKYIPYEQNNALKDQVDAIATLTAKTYNNITGSLGFATKVNGKTVYTDIARTYQNMLDRAVFSITEGKDTFDNEVYKIIKELASSGIKTIDYASGRSYRVDSAVRTALSDGIKNLHMQLNEEFGKQYDADGVEISVHIHPAPDHMYVQGKQFSKEQFYNFQHDLEATSEDGKVFPANSVETGRDRRSIGQYNCYHYTKNIVLGVSKPAYTKEELQEIINKNEKGFDFDGKHYTLYDGSQLQRKIELELRKQKDTQIMAKASYETAKLDEKQKYIDLINESQSKITKLTKKYRDLNEVSGLKSQLDRARVVEYHRINIKNLK